MKVRYSEPSLKQLRKIGKPEAKRILEYMKEIEKLENPKNKGKALVENLNRLWRYRVDDWRVICDINEEEILIDVLRIGHRREIYR